MQVQKDRTIHVVPFVYRNFSLKINGILFVGFQNESVIPK
jgi:hypothetical protein